MLKQIENVINISSLSKIVYEYVLFTKICKICKMNVYEPIGCLKHPLFPNSWSLNGKMYFPSLDEAIGANVSNLKCLDEQDQIVWSFILTQVKFHCNFTLPLALHPRNQESFFLQLSTYPIMYLFLDDKKYGLPYELK